jgi:hypothetical protein
VTVEPSLFAVDPYTHRAFPVAYGLISEEELKQHIINIVRQREGAKE